MSMVLIFEEPEKDDGGKPGRGEPPAKRRPGKQLRRRGLAEVLHRFCGWQSQGYDFAALVAASEMLKHDIALELRQRTLGIRRQQVGVGMVNDGPALKLQALSHDFWKIRHSVIY